MITMDEPDDPFLYNTIEIPTVVGLLRNILTQYPDNGQIIKELVQNAEDAGATVVEVLHDTRQVQCPEAHNDIQRFLNGPALCLYNNGIFTEEDWYGIRKLSDSIKKDDPLKVGQFGLGFKSVFHLTDFVTIISGDKVLFMDPSEPERKMCRIISLNKLMNICPLEDCLDLWGSYVKPQIISDGQYSGTLFWFPLRQSPSNISDTVYSSEHVVRLFASFGVEAPICLTFLKSLEKISLKRIVGDDKHPEVVHEVRLTSPSMSQVQQKRKDFKQKLKECNGFPAQTTVCDYEVTIQSVQGKKTEQQTMRILHYLPGTNDASSVAWRGKKSSRHMPLVGVSAPLSTHGTSSPSGHIFCFLPLPIERANNTNLPVQVNGFFALDQNRRHVKWMTQESSSEPDALWNEELITTVVVEAYFTLLCKVLKETASRSNSYHMETWYSLLPDIKSSKGRWNKLATELWSRLKSYPILYSEVKGCMMKPEDVLADNSLNSWPQHVSNSIRCFLIEQNFPLASVPDTVLASLCSVGLTPPTVTPPKMRQYLRSLKSRGGEWNQTCLLEYVISDENYSDLQGVPLLPLNNGTWSTFSRTSHPVYICGKEAGAFLGLESQVLSTILPIPIVQSLLKIAQKGETQLKQFSPSQHGAVLLSQSAHFVQQSSLSQQQLESWLPKVWSVVGHLDLQHVKNIDLVPTSPSLDSSKLKSLSTAIIVQTSTSPLSEAAVSALDLLKVQVIPKPPEYVRHHQLHKYFSSSDARGVSQALLKVLKMYKSQDLSCNFNMWRNDEQAQALLNVTEVHSLQPQIINLFKELNIFKANGRNGVVIDVSINNCARIFPDINDFPVNFPETLIAPSNETVQQLAKNLGATQLSKEELCLLALQNTYTDNDTSKLVAYIFKDRFLQSSGGIRHQLQFVRFVPNQSGKLFLPSQLYDPEDIDNGALISEDLNPQTCFRKYYSLLRALGMRKVQNMPINEFIKIITNFHKKSLTVKEKVEKAGALLSALNRRPDCQQICQAVRSVSFVYGETSKPVGYPNSLIWATCSNPYKPQDIKSYSHFKNVLGSVVPLVHCSDIQNVANNFGWNQKPDVNHFIEHFNNIIKVYQITEAECFHLIKDTYKQLSAFVNTPDACHLSALSTLPCVFTELGFRDPKTVYITSKAGDLQLVPYMYPLPFELRECGGLFHTLGCFETQSKELFLTLLKQIQQHHCSGKDADVELDWNIVINVLHKLKKYSKDILPSELLLPVENIDESLELIEVNQCSYSEQSCDWIDSKELGVRVVHSRVGTNLAKALGVAPLNKHLLAGEEAFMEWGQHEPLTTRLHNLLRQYRDGVAVLKELVQNADDAGATTISFLYDERQNEDAKTRLINNKLKECQGPALWAYNNAMFTEEDFSNLRKLGAGTKEYQSTKIGKFGLGFCSVYNLTDVPSIVSGSDYIIFDPHLTYLDSNNKTPGVRYNFSNERNSFMLQKLHGQFKPFNEIFGCNIQQTKRFDGTLFRFPLRTPAQASTSEISSVSYKHREMKELLQMFSKIIGELLLFTQHIKEIKVFYLNKNTSSPTESVLLFESSRAIRIASPSGQTPVERVANLFNNGFKWNGKAFQESTFSEIKISCSEEGRKLCNIDQGVWTVTWLTSWHCGKGDSCNFAENLGGKALPLGAVAVPLLKESDGWQLIKLSELPQGFYKESHMHCFLPLPVITPLPVQVNGFFEVAPDRTSLKTQTEDDRMVGLDWNETLMKDAIKAAYHSLLSSLQFEGLSQNCPYYCLWPVKLGTNDRLVSTLTKHFYDSIVKESLQVFRSKNEWHPLNVCRFLEERLHEQKEIGRIAFEFMENLMESSALSMIVLPNYILTGFHPKYISENMITLNIFFSSYFIPNISEQYVNPDKINKLTLHIIDTSHPCLAQLKSVCCIPTRPKGNLKIPIDLIDPKSRIASMYTAADERFPEDLFWNSYNRRSTLLHLGMNYSTISTEMVTNRAETVMELPCHNCGVERSSEILHYIGAQTIDVQKNIVKRIYNVSFLPVMPKPQHWSLRWEGDTLPHNESQVCPFHAKLDVQSQLKSIGFSKPSGICLRKFIHLVGSTNLLLWQPNTNNHELPKSVIEKLGGIVHENKLPLNKVCKQLKIYTTVSPAVSDIKKMCHDIYNYFEKIIQSFKMGIPEELKEMKNEKILLTKHGFMEPSVFALNSDIDCSPDLFSVQSEGLGMYKCLMEALSIGSTFRADVVFQVLIKKKEKYKLDKLNEKEILQMSKLLTLLFSVRNTDVSEHQLPLHLLHLPDTDGYLCPIDKLCCEDGVDLSSGSFNCLHKSISVSLEMTNWLGIKTKTRQRLENSSNRIHFGQSEPLTTRLKNILKDYPCDCGIMKELLQNADDAGATEVAFIKDFRHLPDEKLFDKKWAPLQGPALSVYNNKGFTEKDLQNIQDLGNSMKYQDPASTGQYGIGFNAVYHLTDAPSLLTRGPDVPQGETLCMFDPHCWYDPMATPEKPGVRFGNLNDLRKDHPDSFQGYLENHFLQEEGTVFRLPLRTVEESKISKAFPIQKLIGKIKEFQTEMIQCLLFLRNVRKISIMNISDEGKCNTEYSVQSSIQQQNELSKLQHVMKEGKLTGHNMNSVFNTDMMRVSYEMKITDSNNAEYIWHIVQQLGTESTDSIPEMIKNAFLNKDLSLLPHAGAAVLLKTNRKVNGDLFTLSCYLPLPAKSGLPFSVNGHFALNSSRRDLWTGIDDPKAKWNAWLMKEVLAPAAVYAVDCYRKLIFPENNMMTKGKYLQYMHLCQLTFPDGNNAQSSTWKKFMKWFYECIINQQLCFFDVFIPDNDKFVFKQNLVLEQKGELKWHAFNKDGDEFPIYFANELSIEDNLLDTLRRLGMKVGSDFMLDNLRKVEIKVHILNPNNALKFLHSWNKDYSDKCNPAIMEHIEQTPFLNVKNVCETFTYLSQSEDFLSELEGLPLLLTNSMFLKHFDSKEPVFVSSYCSLLPNSGNEFLNIDMAKLVQKSLKNYKSLSVLKQFTLEDLADRLHGELDQSYHTSEDFLPLGIHALPDEKWLTMLWKFIVKFIKENFNCSELGTSMKTNWVKSKAYIQMAIGDWALYPFTDNKQQYVVAVKNAWRVLDLCGDTDSVFHLLPVPHPCQINIPTELDLTATLKDPSVMLDNLYIHRERIALYVSQDVMMNATEKITEILDYFGRSCQSISLSHDKLSSLTIFEDVSGAVQNLKGKRFIVPTASKLDIKSVANLAKISNTVILKEATSVNIKAIYKYLNSECLVNDLEIYAKIILPNFTKLLQEQRTNFLKVLKDELIKTEHTEEHTWNECLRNTVSILRTTPVIELNGTLKTADNFYDPFNPVFKVINLSNLPDEWAKPEWYYFLKLAGMVHELTAEMYVQYASGLSSSDSLIRLKSETLTQYLFDNFNKLKCSVAQIKSIEFLVPKESKRLEQILPHYRTVSGLVSFSGGVPLKFSNILWTTASLLPEYATSCNDGIKKYLHIMDTPSEEMVFEHMCKLCEFLKSKPEKSNPGIEHVMESIYQYLEQSSDRVLDMITCQNIPIVHIPKCTFVTAKSVIENLENEIIPYLYTAPIRYGKYINVFKNLGAIKVATCDTYAQILKMIYGKSQNQILHPEEKKCMQLALKGLLNNQLKLKNLTVTELYLPTKEGKMGKSSEMYVADIEEYLEVSKGKLNVPIFAGFAVLKMPMNDADFVKRLPTNLQLKFLSRAVKEDLDSSTEEMSTELLNDLKEFLYCESFRQAVLRIINHDKAKIGFCLDKAEVKELKSILHRIEVKQVKAINTTLKFNEEEVGKRARRIFVKATNSENKKITLYISDGISSQFIVSGLCEAYMSLLNITSVQVMKNLSGILRLYKTPQSISSFLNELNITAWVVENSAHELYRRDVGSYLHEELIHLLDNEFCKFHEGEIVCLKKYILGGAEDTDEENTYIIVQVKHLVRSHGNLFLDEYKVYTGCEVKSCVIIPAHQLYKFVRTKGKDCSDMVPTEQVDDDSDNLDNASDNLSEEEIMKNIRKQMKEIWKVADEKEKRHLIRRLILKWHPDKNSHRIELSTRLMQYILNVLKRLKNGEVIPDDDDDEDIKASRSAPKDFSDMFREDFSSDFYRNMFRPPPRQHTGSFRSHRHTGSFGYSGSSRSQAYERKMADHPEALKWLKQAEHDIAEACKHDGGSSCWIMFMCYQAAEKILKAALYLEDRNKAATFENGGTKHSLKDISSSLQSEESYPLAADIDTHVGHHTNMLYPSVNGCPCDNYNNNDAKYMLDKTNQLMHLLRPYFMSK